MIESEIKRLLGLNSKSQISEPKSTLSTGDQIANYKLQTQHKKSEEKSGPITSVKSKSKVEQVKPKESIKSSDIIENPKDIKSISDISKIKMSIFRGKGLSPKMIVKNILDRIEELLEKQDISRDSIVSLWKSSEPYKLYLAIGRESMRSNKTIEQIFSERRSFGKPYLTREEFDAVADISRSLQE